MTIFEVLEILESFICGVSPYTGEVYSHKNVIQNPRTKLALRIARDHLIKGLRAQKIPKPKTIFSVEAFIDDIIKDKSVARWWGHTLK